MVHCDLRRIGKQVIFMRVTFHLWITTYMKKFFSPLTTFLCVISIAGALLFSGGVLADKPLPGLQSSSFLGSYLAGRYASSNHDTIEAAQYMRRALDYEPNNKRILEQSFLLELMGGDWERSTDLSKKLIKLDAAHPFARLFRGVDEFRLKNYSAAEEHFLASSDGPLGALIEKISQAWILSEKGDYSKAMKLLNEKSDTDWVRDYQQYHRALIADVNGKVKDAQRAYSRLYRKYHQMVRLVGSYAQFLAKNNQRRAALTVLDKHFKRARFRHPDLVLIQEKIKAKIPLASHVTTAQEGLAEIFFSLGDRRSETGGIDDGLIFLQMARLLRPQFAAANYSLANLLYRVKKYDRSLVYLSSIDESEPIWLDAQILKAQCLSSKKQPDMALQLLEGLRDKYSTDIDLFNALGKLNLDEKKYAEASANYSKAISLLKKPRPSDWFYYYGRGISYERAKMWPKAEKDFKQALKLSPNRPDVLNYLGYSWVDQNLNLSNAMKLIRKAVKLKPNSGYYVDSLGWAHYRLGQYKEAVGILEKAVMLRPDDPVINDHLGDVYWRVGRKNEARFQWKQVLSLEPEEDLIKQVNQKMKDGLPEKRQAKATLKKK